MGPTNRSKALVRRLVRRVRAAAARARSRVRAAETAGEPGQPDLAGYRMRVLFGIETAVVRFDRATYFVPKYAARRPIARQILSGQHAEPELHRLVKTVMRRRPGSLIHAGTFFGDMLPSFSRATPGLVYAFEPVLENYLLSWSVVDRNQLDNVVLLHAGLGANLQLAKITTEKVAGKHRGGAAGIVRDPGKLPARWQRTALLAIDQLAIPDISMIQLDVEGWESEVLKGAVETIRSQEPVIVVEDLRHECGQLLEGLGYAEVASIGPNHLYLTPAAEREFARDLSTGRTG